MMSNIFGLIVMLLTSLAGGLAVYFAASAILAGADRRIERRLTDSITRAGLSADRTVKDIPVSGLFGRLLRYARRLLGNRYFTRLVDRLATSDRLAHLERRIVKAGATGTFTAREYLAAKVLAALVVSSAGLLQFLGGDTLGLVLAIILALIGYRLSDIFVTNMIEARQDAIRRSLSKAADILVIAVEAGLTFDKAIDLYCERFQGPLAEEFEQAREEVKVGRRRREALTAMVNRVDVEDLRLLVNSILQAERFGVPMAEVLRNQSQELKIRREQYIREQSMKAPVKMLLPMVLLIMPALFCVLLGPIALTIMRGGLF